MFREQEGKKVVETDRFASDPKDYDKVKMVFQHFYDAKDTSGPFSSANPPI